MFQSRSGGGMGWRPLGDHDRLPRKEAGRRGKGGNGAPVFFRTLRAEGGEERLVSYLCGDLSGGRGERRISP